jgi:2-dehydropantoate 2-reductase
MHVLILGAGAIGSLLGARLAGTQARVSLFSTDRAHIEAIRQAGLFIEQLDGSLTNHPLSAFYEAGRLPADPDLIVVCVKSYATEAAVAGIRHLQRPSTVFLTLQNGIGNWETIAGLTGWGSVLAGTTALGATRVAPGRIRHGGNGPTLIGEPNGPASERTGAIVRLFREAGLEAGESDDVERLIWEKLIINAGINAVTALTGIRNGGIAESAQASAVCRAAVEEAVLVARARGLDIGTDMANRVLEVAGATARNRSSMGQDVDGRQRTEIDAINGAVVRFAKQAGIDVPVNRVLTGLVKTLEANYLS